ncbi:MAG: aspartate ammonia-lyase [Deltaproteobacteria bacterium RIFCSPLOWO2_12_FULL_40_28]|nr:MAG: aspartate ammonia-lyase [Deltaproteobacteria bacterium RIFCSPHIGHO2_02_FULL_40_28]OGQ19897.1 MAG: aspartate ammonia-lyase [Deltaproteobacteria bacterium RIFCSPHIGHO2_12_FULL_40_32]OGQ39656.1 MAG: aspartate ammonia-lyase [Deltaproteobacteria bacterium RIFCSPLOWO2_02_FULL_40_36]OGQ52912.1 MAG: aspartate ammonia-lyase [Deltaproteobacteria bacterium RIFCSPLOWO2_12_FULL_40_28]
MANRVESDSMGEIKIPNEFLYGASTQRAVENFKVSNRRFDRRFIQALGLVKWAAAVANTDLGKLDKKIGEAIAKKALEVATGTHDFHFVLDIYQTGSGTSTNMNANEVIANLCNPELGGIVGSKKPVHPNDHVNCGQSSNDVIPTTIHVGAALGFSQGLIPALTELKNSFEKKAKEFSQVIKIGRTHLQDATPITLGQEFSGYASQIEQSIKRSHQALDGLLELAIGGTAVGTGINTHPQFAKKVCENLNQQTKLKFSEAKNHFEAQSAKDACVFASGALKTVAISLMKIANDLRWLASGPRCGIHEIHLPELQPGSSIMPGKINPVIPESVMQIAAQVQGNDLAIQIGGQHGNFELNVMMPVIAGNLFESIKLLANGSSMLATKCVNGIEANTKRCKELMEASLALVTNLNPVIGYDKAAAVSKKAYKENKTIRQVLIEEKILSEKEIDKLLDPKIMLNPK